MGQRDSGVPAFPFYTRQASSVVICRNLVSAALHSRRGLRTARPSATAWGPTHSNTCANCTSAGRSNGPTCLRRRRSNSPSWTAEHRAQHRPPSCSTEDGRAGIRRSRRRVGFVPALSQMRALTDCCGLNRVRSRFRIPALASLGASGSRRCRVVRLAPSRTKTAPLRVRAGPPAGSWRPHPRGRAPGMGPGPPLGNDMKE